MSAVGPEGLRSASIRVNLKSSVTMARGERAANLEKVLKDLDKNGDGQIDKDELLSAVETMLETERQRRMLLYISVALVTCMALLIGALTGMTYGIVRLAQETRIEGGQIAVAKDTGLPVLNGGATIDLRGTFNATNTTALNQTSNGRKLMATMEAQWSEYYTYSTFPQKGLVSMGTLDASIYDQGCTFVTAGLNSFIARVALGSNADAFSSGEIKVLSQSGCGSDTATVEAAAVLYNNPALGAVDLTYEVFCPRGASTCDVFLVVDKPAAAAAEGVGRRLQQNFVADAIRNMPTIEVWLSSSTMPDCPKSPQWQNAVLSRQKNGQFLYLWWTCVSVMCFPASARVQVEERGSVRMDELQWGDKVRSVDRSTGKVGYKEVYLFGHRDAQAVSEDYIQLTTAAANLTLSDGHFIPVCVPSAAGPCRAGAPRSAVKLEYKYAKAVVAGDFVLVEQEAGAVLTEVLSVRFTVESGMFTPFVRGSDLIVDGVVASPHTYWHLDPYFPDSLKHLMPAVYEVVLSPLWLLNKVLGPVGTEYLHTHTILREYGLTTILGVTGITGTVVALAAGAVTSTAMLAASYRRG